MAHIAHIEWPDAAVLDSALAEDVPPFGTPAIERAKRPSSRLRRLLGTLGSVALMAFTLLMVWIMLFDGAPGEYCFQPRGFSYDDAHDEYDAWTFCIPHCLWKRRVYWEREPGEMIAQESEPLVEIPMQGPLLVALILAATAVCTLPWKQPSGSIDSKHLRVRNSP